MLSTKRCFRSATAILATAVAVKGALERVPQLDAKEIEDVILGCAMPEAEQGMNVAPEASAICSARPSPEASTTIVSAMRSCIVRAGRSAFRFSVSRHDGMTTLIRRRESGTSRRRFTASSLADGSGRGRERVFPTR